MTETPRGHETFDAEIAAPRILGFGAGLIGIVALVLVAMKLLSGGFARWDASRPIATPALTEARTQPPPPAPLLQAAPRDDLARLRREEDGQLSGYAWVDRGNGVARIPIERAMEIVVERSGKIPREAAR
ncbi:MAG: hypothetical protein U0166_28205 [Acidobacteriota bacterium]